jgi:hypothetical protein
MPINIQLRRDTASGWTAENPVLKSSELAAETNTRRIKIGDGSTPWNLLPYSGTIGPAGRNGAPNSIAGTLAYFPTATTPAGWLRTDGSTISSTAYPELSALLAGSSNLLAAPTSINTEGAYGFSWTPGLTLFDPYVDSDVFATGEYLSNQTMPGEQITAFNFSFAQPVVLSDLTILNMGYGIAPTYWKLVSGTDIIAETAPNSLFLAVGGVTTYSGNAFIPNWYSLNNTLARQTYTLIVAHTVGYPVDIGITRILFKQTVTAPVGSKILPTLPTQPAGLTSLYPYIKT